MNTKRHFHSLDALRFFAFLKVYFLHIPIQGEFPVFAFLKSGGGIGVAFFFVLSGFLITYLLVFEKEQLQQINIPKFLWRRSLRIWPLFYLIVLVVFLLPYSIKDYWGLHMIGGGYDFDWRYSFTFLENYKMLATDNIPKTTPLSVFWSLCIEEHFYIVWVVGLFLIPLRHVTKFLSLAILLSVVARYVEPFVFHNANVLTNDLLTNLDYFACGGLLGRMIAKDDEKVSGFIQGISPILKWSILAVIVAVVIFQNQLLPYQPGTVFFLFRSTIIAVLFTILIALFLPSDSSIKIKSRWLSALGIRTYGMYVYHILFVHITFQYFIRHELKIDNWQTLSLFIFITLVATIITSFISFKYIEKPFLVLRDKVK